MFRFIRDLVRELLDPHFSTDEVALETAGPTLATEDERFSIGRVLRFDDLEDSEKTHVIVVPDRLDAFVGSWVEQVLRHHAPDDCSEDTIHTEVGAIATNLDRLVPSVEDVENVLKTLLKNGRLIRTTTYQIHRWERRVIRRDRTWRAR